MVEEILHEGHDPGVIGGGRQDDLAVAEGVLQGLGHVAAGEIRHRHLGAALLAQEVRQLLRRGGGVAVEAGVGDEDALALHAVAAPGLVEVQHVGDGLRQDGAVEGADGGNVQPGGLLENGLDLGAVLAHDVEVVAPGLAVPVLLRVQGAELAEGVRAEEDLLRALIAHHDLRPVDHGGGDEVEHVAAQGELVPLLHREGGGEVQPREVLGKEREGLGPAHEFHLRPALHHRLNAGGVVRLDVVDDEVVRLPAREGGFQVFQVLRALVVVHGVQDGHLLVQDHVGIVGHAVGDHILALEEIDVVIVDADVADAVSHRFFLLASDAPPGRRNLPEIV